MQQKSKQIIPPSHICVKAGFVAYTPDDENRKIIILNSGELVAQKTEMPYANVFTMRPGDLVGVAALLEREQFKYRLLATKNSEITIIDEDCMESELKRLPLWLLALIRSMSSKTYELKKAAVQTRVKNTLKSLAEYLSKKKSNCQYLLVELIQEFKFLTKIDAKIIEENIKSLSRRKFIKLEQINKNICCTILDSELLSIFSDYLFCEETRSNSFIPYKLTVTQKKILVYISTIDSSIIKSGPDWANLLHEKFSEVDVSEWPNLLNLGLFSKSYDNFFVNKSCVNYFLKALRYETNIRGII